jgi:glutathione S-transferase
MQLIASLTSPFARKIRVILLEKNLPHELVVDVPNEPETRVPEYNPLGKVPALVVDDGDVFFDSPVIAAYLETLDAAPALLPADPLARVHVRQFEALSDGVLDSAVLVLNESRRPPVQQSLSWTERHWGKVERGIGELERLSVGRRWLYGDSMTLADIAVACMYAWIDFRFPHYAIGPKHPSLARWAQPILARPSFTQTELPLG